MAKPTFEFSVPDGDWDYDAKTETYRFKPLVFTERSVKKACAAVKEYAENGTMFTMSLITGT